MSSNDRSATRPPDGEAGPPAPTIKRHAAIAYETVPPNEQLLKKAWVASTPGLALLANYRRHWLRPDVFAGVAVAAYMIPQCMAYSAIVGVDLVVGLWTALAALLVYAAMGASRILSVGPESTVALMAGTAVAPLAGGDPVKAMTLAAALSIIVGLWCFVARFLRLGVVAELLSQPLLVGYLAGGAILMVVGQLGKMTGTPVEGESIVEQGESFAGVIGRTHLPTLLVGAGTLALILLIHWWKHKWPSPLIAVALATVASTVLDFQSRGIAVVGAVPTGLPLPTIPAISGGEAQALIVAGIGVAIVAYGDNTLVARGFPAPLDKDESRSVNEVNPNVELTALGGASIAVGLVGGYPVSSSGSRTALALSAGARTQMYSLVAAAVITVVLFIAGPLVANLPKAALGAVVVYAASKLVRWADIKRLAKFRKRELMLAITATIGTVVFGILAGVGIAIALSVLEMSQRIARPNDGVLGRVPGVAGMHNVLHHKAAQTLPGLIVYRFDAPLFFGNISELRRRAMRVVNQEEEAYPNSPPRWFILNVEANVEIDITAADGLSELHEDLAAHGIRFGLARVKRDLRAPLDRAGLIDQIGEDMLFPTLPTAEEAYIEWALEDRRLRGEEYLEEETALMAILLEEARAAVEQDRLADEAEERALLADQADDEAVALIESEAEAASDAASDGEAADAASDGGADGETGVDALREMLGGSHGPPGPGGSGASGGSSGSGGAGPSGASGGPGASGGSSGSGGSGASGASGGSSGSGGSGASGASGASGSPDGIGVPAVPKAPSSTP